MGIRSVCDTFLPFFKDYLTDAPADIQVITSMDDIVYERNRAAREDRLEGIPLRRFPDQYLETLAIYRKIAVEMLRHDTLLFHGSAISVDGEGFLFTAKSGTGKSTHTRLWREMFGDRAVMVNDDKPLLKIEDDRVMVCGTPWDGKHCLGTNIMVPLKGLCILTRAEENHIQRISASEAMPMLLQQSFRPDDPVAVAKLLGLLEKMAQRVGLYRLGCNMDPEAAAVAYQGMK